MLVARSISRLKIESVSFLVVGIYFGIIKRSIFDFDTITLSIQIEVYHQVVNEIKDATLNWISKHKKVLRLDLS